MLEALRCDYPGPVNGCTSSCSTEWRRSAPRLRRPATPLLPVRRAANGPGRGLLAGPRSARVRSSSPIGIPHISCRGCSAAAARTGAGAVRGGRLERRDPCLRAGPVVSDGAWLPGVHAAGAQGAAEHLTPDPTSLRSHGCGHARPPDNCESWPSRTVGGRTATPRRSPRYHGSRGHGGRHPRGRSCGGEAAEDVRRPQVRRYGEDHNHPDRRHEPPLAVAALRPHLGAHEVFAAVMTHERWTSRRHREAARRRARGLVGHVAVGRDVPRSARRLARVGVQRIVRGRPASAATTRPCRGRARHSRQHGRIHARTTTTCEALDAAADVTTTVWNAAQQATEDAKAGSTATCGCCGARRSSNGSSIRADALARMEQLMNRYSLDGRDPCRTRATGGCWASTIGRGPNGRSSGRSAA